MAKKPTMFILAGANGSGKSTLYQEKIKPLVGAPFINADVIQKNELKDSDPRASYKAAQIAVERRNEHFANKTSFVTETVFSHVSKLKLVTDAKDAGFYVALYHVGLKSANLNVSRVGNRVKAGGHDVPEQKIRDRRERGEGLISQAARLADRAFVYDNSVYGKKPTLGIKFKNGQVIDVGENLPKWQRDLYAADLKRFSAARLNPAAASYDVVDRMAKHIAETNEIRASIPQKGKSYEGPLVGESARHILQRNGATEFTAHFKQVVGDGLTMGQNVKINYKTRRAAEVIEIEAGQRPDPKALSR